ncbi:MAG: hypothetical protein HUJ80_01695 [Firmicutes bacterium]|nr:hypothetical protein [Bacillota bacterium]
MQETKQPQNKTMVRDLTNGNVAKLLLTFAAPLFVSNALQAIYNIVDMIVVKKDVRHALPRPSRSESKADEPSVRNVDKPSCVAKKTTPKGTTQSERRYQ